MINCFPDCSSLSDHFIELFRILFFFFPLVGLFIFEAFLMLLLLQQNSGAELVLNENPAEQNLIKFSLVPTAVEWK